MLAGELALIKRLGKLTLNSEMATILSTISQILVDGTYHELVWLTLHCRINITCFFPG